MNLTEGVHKFIQIILDHLAEDFGVDRLGIFLPSSEGGKYFLRGVHGKIENETIDQEVIFPFEFKREEPIVYTPTQGFGWDAVVSIWGNEGVIALLAIDDTSAAKEFTQEQRSMLMHIKLFLEAVFKHRALVDEFRFVDPLTGILNRRGLAWKSEEVEAIFKRNPNTKWAVSFIDLDFFGELNKKHGHPFGDLVLKEVVKNLEAKLRADDVIARYGGEEFVIIQANDPKNLQSRLQDMLEEFSRLRFEEDGHSEDGISFSGGVVSLLPGEKVMDAIKRAVQLLKEAKRTRYTVLVED